MHFVAHLFAGQLDALRQEKSRSGSIRLRGYDAATWVKPELFDIKLPVNAIAYNLCPTSRDLYLERVEGSRAPQTWERYTGKVIDSTYKAIHRKCEEYFFKHASLKCSLPQYLARSKKRIIEYAKNEHAQDFNNIRPIPNQSRIRQLEDTLKKIIMSETSLASSLLDVEVSKIDGANAKGIFEEYLSFNTDLVLKSLHLGFSEKATPDFVYRHEVMGDIKTGKWYEFFLYTAIAYVLAYEDHTRKDIDYGVILHPEFPRRKKIPIYGHTNIRFIDDRLRHAFIAIRDRKLQIIKEGKDPGKPDSKDKCDSECPFVQECWGGEND